MRFFASFVVFIVCLAMILISDVYKKFRDEASDTLRRLEAEQLRQKVMVDLESQDVVTRRYPSKAGL